MYLLSEIVVKKITTGIFVLSIIYKVSGVRLK